MSIIKSIVAVSLIFSLTGCMHHHGRHNGGHRVKARKVSVQKVERHNVWMAGHWKKHNGKTIWIEGYWR